MMQNKNGYCKDLTDFTLKENLSVNILFVTRDKANDSYDVFKGNLSKDVGQNLQELCKKIVKKSYNKPDKKRFENYDPSQRENSHTEFLEDQKLEGLRPVLNLIESKNIPLEKIDTPFLDSLWFYVIVLDDGHKKFMLFKKYSSSMILTKSFKLAITFRGGSFDKLKQNIFMITDKADCIYFSEKVIIRSKGNFEKIFNFLKQIKSNANKAVKVIENDLPFTISNLSDIKKTWLDNEMMIRKLNNIYSKGLLQKIEPKNIEILVQQGLVKKIKFEKDNKGHLSISGDDPWEILNILDDSYVKSLLTGINYEASKKRELR